MPTQDTASASAAGASLPQARSPAEGEERGPQPTSKDAVAADGRPINSSRAESPPKLPPPDAATTDFNPKKRVRSPPPADEISAEQYHEIMTKQQSIEIITQKEALHHVEMAWRAQQRLVQRCLGLRFFGEEQSADANDADAAASEDAVAPTK